MVLLASLSQKMTQVFFGGSCAILPVVTKAPTNQIKGMRAILGGNLFLGSLKSGKVLVWVLYGSIHWFYWLQSW